MTIAHDLHMARLRVAELERELAEADRRAGAAERRLKDAWDRINRQEAWLMKAKEARGYHRNTSFDVVWDEVCALADKVKENADDPRG